ncbi:hypothetical protein [Microbacterium resistens]
MSDVAASGSKKPNTSLLIRGAIWIAIGALIAAALVCVVWVLVGDQQGLIGRAFLTILLLAGFAGIAILEASLAPTRPDWLALLSMISWIVALLVGAVKIWLPEKQTFNDYDFGVDSGFERFFHLVLVVAILQLAMLHVRLFWRASQRYVTTFTRVIVYTTFGFLGVLVAMLVFFLTFPHAFSYSELFWRIVVALTILAAVGTTLLPLLNALFAPKRPVAQPAVSSAWPTYADGRTPLPVLRDGSPDWNAYYTGVPTIEAAPAIGGYPGQAAPPASPAAFAADPFASAPAPASAGGSSGSAAGHQLPPAASAPVEPVPPVPPAQPEPPAQPDPPAQPEPPVPPRPEPPVPPQPEPPAEPPVPPRPQDPPVPPAFPPAPPAAPQR